MSEAAKKALEDKKVRGALEKIKKDAERSGTKVIISDSGGGKLAEFGPGAGSDDDLEAASEILEEIAAPVVAAAVGDDFKPEGNGQVDLEGKKVVYPITSTDKLVKHFTYENIRAKISFTENAIKNKCLDPPEGKDAISIRVFVQQRIKFKSEKSLGDEMVDLVNQFTEELRADWV